MRSILLSAIVLTCVYCISDWTQRFSNAQVLSSVDGATVTESVALKGLTIEQTLVSEIIEHYELQLSEKTDEQSANSLLSLEEQLKQEGKLRYVYAEDKMFFLNAIIQERGGHSYLLVNVTQENGTSTVKKLFSGDDLLGYKFVIGNDLNANLFRLDDTGTPSQQSQIELVLYQVKSAESE